MSRRCAAARLLGLPVTTLALLLTAPAPAQACNVTYAAPAAVASPGPVPGAESAPGLPGATCSRTIPLAGAAAVAATAAVATAGYGAASFLRGAAAARALGGDAVTAALPALAPAAARPAPVAAARAAGFQAFGPPPATAAAHGRRARRRGLNARYARVHAKTLGTPPPAAPGTQTPWFQLPVTHNGQPVPRAALNTPQADSVYTCNGITHHTDAQARVVRVQGHLSVQRGVQPRDEAIQRAAGGWWRRWDDAGGHIVANVLGGCSEAVNVLAQNHRFMNNRVFRGLENYWRELLRAGHTIEIDHTVQYHGTGTRPTTIHLRWTVNGRDAHEIVLPF